MIFRIECDDNCKDCYFKWKNAQHNQDCFLEESWDQIVKANKNMNYK